MNYNGYFAMKKLAEHVSCDGVLLIFVSAATVLFFAVLIYKLKYPQKERSARVTFCIISLCLVTAVSAVYLAADVPFNVFAFYFAAVCVYSAIISLPLCFIKPREKDYGKERQLIKYIDGQIKKEKELYSADSLSVAKPIAENTESIVCKERESEKPVPEKDKINFTHVKNVIERLNYFDLSASDKKQVEELKDLLYAAENFGITGENKYKINDGLSSLLKIMSKYGV